MKKKQKTKKMLTLGIFECPLTQNLTNQYPLSKYMEGYQKTQKQGSLRNYFCKTFDACRPNHDAKFKPKTLSNLLHQIKSINYQNQFLDKLCIKKFH